MHLDLLAILKCPFCGSSLELDQQTAHHREKNDISSGVLGCQCSAYPVVEGIPYIRAGKLTDRAVEQVTNGQLVEAFYTLMGLENSQREQWQSLIERQKPMTFRDALQVLCPPAEGEYFLYRFSDPTFLISVSLLRAVGPHLTRPRRWMIDLCGGTGHLTSKLLDITPAAGVILGDFYFWKIWLAKKFIAPRSHPVCCNANDPLPFAANICSLILCSGAFEYIWSRRLLANEMTRVIDKQGAVIITHTHNSLCENASEGMPLTPAGYRRLFETIPHRIFKESAILDALLKSRFVDLSPNFSDKELKKESALICIGTRNQKLFRRHRHNNLSSASSESRTINPLYQVNSRNNSVSLKLKFPSREYESEFIACKRYLPSKAALSPNQFAGLATGKIDSKLQKLSNRLVVLELPQNYL